MTVSPEAGLFEEKAQPIIMSPVIEQPGIVDFAPGIEAAFPNQFEEVDCLAEISGDPLPDFLRGTYYLNGPARFGFKDLTYHHWLDGDGMVCAVRFEKSAVRMKSRYIRSRKFTEEQSAGRPMFRTFGTAFSDSRLNLLNNGIESPVNVSVYAMHDRLLAFGEQCLPWELDPDTLETLGQCTFNRQLHDACPFSAHPKFDPESGEMFNFGISYSSQAPRLHFYCFGPEGLHYRKAVPLEYPCSVHDFSLSKNFAVFYLSPYLLDAPGLLQGGRTVMESLHWEPDRESRMLILARATGEVVSSIALGHRYCLHLINSFEQNNRLTVDVLEFDEPLYSHYQPIPGLFQHVPSGGPVRFIVDLQSHELAQRIPLGYTKAPDFPAIDPQSSMRRYSDFWMLGISAAGRVGRKFFDQLVHASWNHPSVCDLYRCPPFHYLAGEPVFVGTACEGGLVICPEFDARGRQTCLLVFNAGKISAGPVTRLAFERVLYLGLHAGFSPARGVS